jgi:hypothetical protein
MVKKQNIFQKFENSWIFWVLFILTAMAIFTIAMVGFEHVLSGYLFIPLGILMLFNIFPEGITVLITIIIWYSTMIVLIRYIVNDKRFNTKLIVIIITLLILTLKGCTEGVM